MKNLDDHSKFNNIAINQKIDISNTYSHDQSMNSSIDTGELHANDKPNSNVVSTSYLNDFNYNSINDINNDLIKKDFSTPNLEKKNYAWRFQNDNQQSLLLQKYKKRQNYIENKIIEYQQCVKKIREKSRLPLSSVLLYDIDNNDDSDNNNNNNNKNNRNSNNNNSSNNNNNNNNNNNKKANDNKYLDLNNTKNKTLIEIAKTFDNKMILSDSNLLNQKYIEESLTLDNKIIPKKNNTKINIITYSNTR